MKKILSVTFLLCCIIILSAQQPGFGQSEQLFKDQSLITAYTFPTGGANDIFPDQGLEINKDYYIIATDIEGNNRSIDFTNGFLTKAATTDGWNEGSENKYWEISFKAEYFKDIKVTSMQRAGGNKAGPKDWKIQSKLGSGDWEDVLDGAVTCANNWDEAYVFDLSLPESYNNPGNQLISIRWIMTSNMSINNEPVNSNGVSKIDEVFVSGILTSDIGETSSVRNFSFYPNPLTGRLLYLKNAEQIWAVKIYGLCGKLIKTIKNPSEQIQLSGISRGCYLVQAQYSNGNTSPAQRLIIN